MGTGNIEVDYEAAMPPYRQVAAWLRQHITSGEWPPGKRLPSEQQVMGMTGVSRGTARRAVRLLAAEGLVVTTPGRGTHVVQPGPA